MPTVSRSAIQNWRLAPISTGYPDAACRLAPDKLFGDLLDRMLGLTYRGRTAAETSTKHSTRSVTTFYDDGNDTFLGGALGLDLASAWR
jgi:hypothetical protein